MQIKVPAMPTPAPRGSESTEAHKHADMQTKENGPGVESVFGLWSGLIIILGTMLGWFDSSELRLQGTISAEIECYARNGTSSNKLSAPHVAAQWSGVWAGPATVLCSKPSSL